VGLGSAPFSWLTIASLSRLCSSFPRLRNQTRSHRPHLDSVEVCTLDVPARHISQRILMASFLRYFRVQFFHSSPFQRIVGSSAGIARILRQPCDFFLCGIATHGQAIHRNILLKKKLEYFVLLVVIELFSVHAIGDDQDNFSVGPDRGP